MVLKYQHPFNSPDLADGWGSWAGGRSQAHRGLDYQPGSGASIPAASVGVVSANMWHSGLGWVLVIAHPDGYYSGYCHMLNQSSLGVGTSVAIGQIIGQVGNTGTSSNGAHLHLTITVTADGTWNNADMSVTLDPWPFINDRLNGTIDPEEEMPIYSHKQSNTVNTLVKDVPKWLVFTGTDNDLAGAAGGPGAWSLTVHIYYAGLTVGEKATASLVIQTIATGAVSGWYKWTDEGTADGELFTSHTTQIRHEAGTRIFLKVETNGTGVTVPVWSRAINNFPG